MQSNPQNPKDSTKRYSSQINQQTGKTEETGKYYSVYIPLGHNFFVLKGVLTEKAAIDELVSSFESSNQTEDDYLPEIVKLAKADFINSSSSDPNSVIVTTIQENQWKDSSLDCPKKGQTYTQVITPGYRVLMSTKQGYIEYHTDKNTNFIKCY